MSAETSLQQIERMVTELLSSEPEYFVVEVKLKPTNNIKIFIDGDNGISIEKCVYFNRFLYKKIEQANLFPDGDFSLEVSSPGVDNPLKFLRQYQKNIGRNVEVAFNDGSLKEGKLIEAGGQDLILEQLKGKGKKTEKQKLVIPFSNIKTITVQIQF